MNSGLKVRLTRSYAVKKGKRFVTYRVTLPKDLVDALGFSSERELVLEIVVHGGEKAILLRRGLG